LLCSTLERLVEAAAAGENYAVNTFQAVECHKNRKEEGKREAFVCCRRQVALPPPRKAAVRPTNATLGGSSLIQQQQ